MITAISVFMLATVVSADGEKFKRFHGVYYMTAKANGLISTCGYEEGGPPYIAKTEVEGQECHVWAAADTAQGTWIFRRDGTGSAGGWNYAFDFPPGPPGIGPRARDNPFNFDFNYEISSKGVIKVWVTSPGLTSLEMEGMVSQDHKTMTLNNAYTFFNPATIFMASRVLIKIRNYQDDD
jgi:hypothetical protein